MNKNEKVLVPPNEIIFRNPSQNKNYSENLANVIGDICDYMVSKDGEIGNTLREVAYNGGIVCIKWDETKREIQIYGDEYDLSIHYKIGIMHHKPKEK